ncbi:MAG: SPOR domain-containing protein [Candidatus Nanopelagicales bacterium]|nr:SPOR domain-containing protein [Candidatus Nanopelagicales bacterium]
MASWWYCLNHGRVEEGAACANADRLGPYESREEAAHALDRVRERNEAWQKEDERWNGETTETQG